MSAVAVREHRPWGGGGWCDWALQVRQFLTHQGCSAGDAVVLLPLAEHLPLARQAWAAQHPEGLMPRFETCYTLAQAVAVPVLRAAGEYGGDAVQDGLSAELLLRAQPWGEDWARRDRPGFERLLASLLGCAGALAHAWAALLPQDRPGWLVQARAALAAPGTAPGGLEALLARVALEWVAGTGEPPSDALFEWRARAWVELQAGGPDPLVAAVGQAAQAGGSAVLEVLTDPPEHDPFAQAVPPLVLRCRDFEDEAQRTAERVLAALAQDARPVALVALDRLLVRRVRALLEVRGLQVADETGWKLSTTRAAAAVMAWLRAARPQATADDLLDALKCGWGQGPQGSEAAMQGAERLERWLRRHRVASAWGQPPEPGPARGLWHELGRCLQPLRGAAPASLADWLMRLREVLQAVGAWEPLWADEAGAQALNALRVPGAAAVSAAWQQASTALRLTSGDFAQWVDSVFERVPFEPSQPLAMPDVVITPLSRALLRPFGAVVVPGCDASRLGAAPAPVPLLGPALAVRLGLRTPACQRAAEQAAFALLLKQPQVSLLYREADQGRPLGPSPLLLRLQLALQRRDVVLPQARDTRVARTVPAAVATPPSPVLGPAGLPARISATAYEALRDCPYRFAGLHAWGLAEAAELDDEPDARDWGRWLHAVLERFHASAPGAAPGSVNPQADLAALQAAADQVSTDLGLTGARFLPRRCEFEAMARRYVAWWHEQRCRGSRVVATEVTREQQPPWLRFTQGDAVLQVTLKGVLDRIDHVVGDDGRGCQRVLDYKTTDPRVLKQRAGAGAEDTQMAFYALLLADEDAAGVGSARPEAAYLALRHNGVELVPHAGVADSARRLQQGLQADLMHIVQGAGLPALGEGRVCETCAARGLCRRDEWSGRTL
jgi:ATP-dependent helicase/nuclease subunit B